MLRSVIVVLFVGMVAVSSGCTDLHITFEVPPKTCLSPSTPEAEPSSTPDRAKAEPAAAVVQGSDFAQRARILYGQLGGTESASMASEFRSGVIDPDLMIPIYHCILEERKANPELKGTVTIRYKVAANGDLISVALDADWEETGKFINCVHRAFKNYEFSVDNQGDHKIVIPEDLPEDLPVDVP